MKKIVFALLLALCAGSACAQKYSIIQNGIGFGVVDALPTDTGVRIDRAVWVKLTPAQLSDLMSQRDSEKSTLEIPLNTQTRAVGWNKYLTHMTVERRYTEVAVLQDKEIIKVAKEGSVRWEQLNPIFVFGFLFIMGVLYASRTLCVEISPEGSKRLRFPTFLLVFFVWAFVYFFTFSISGINPLILLFTIIPAISFFLGINFHKRWYLALSILAMVGLLMYIFALT